MENWNDLPPVVLHARLTKYPQSLHDFWKECEFGFSGCRPAKDTRGMFFGSVSELIWVGYTADRVVDFIEHMG